MVGVVGSNPIVPTRILRRYLENAFGSVISNDDHPRAISSAGAQGRSKKGVRLKQSGAPFFYNSFLSLIFSGVRLCSPGEE